MTKKLFNRRDVEVIEFALSNSLENFIENYKETSASEDTLTKVYQEINKDKTKSKIAVDSGDTKPNEPIKTSSKQNQGGRKGVTLGEDGELHPIDFEAVEKKQVEKIEEVKEKKLTNSTVDKKQLPTKRDFIKNLLEENFELTNKQVKEKVIEAGYEKIYDSEIISCRKKIEQK